jgi:hypothetical protein
MARVRIAVFMAKQWREAAARSRGQSRVGKPAKKTVQKVNYFCGIPQMGDAVLAKSG